VSVTHEFPTRNNAEYVMENYGEIVLKTRKSTVFVENQI
jgi:hypothetical protein